MAKVESRCEEGAEGAAERGGVRGVAGECPEEESRLEIRHSADPAGVAQVGESPEEHLAAARGRLYAEWAKAAARAEGGELSLTLFDSGGQDIGEVVVELRAAAAFAEADRMRREDAGEGKAGEVEAGEVEAGEVEAGEGSVGGGHDPAEGGGEAAAAAQAAAHAAKGPVRLSFFRGVCLGCRRLRRRRHGRHGRRRRLRLGRRPAAGG